MQESTQTAGHGAVFRTPAADPALEPIRACLRQQRAPLAWMMAVCLAIAGVAWRLWLFSDRINPASSGAVGCTALVMGLTCGAFLVPILRIEKTKIIVLLRDHPDRVLWVFAGNLRLRVNGIELPNPEQLLHFYVENGESYRLRYIAPDRFDEIWASVAVLLRHAMFGYTDANRIRYAELTNTQVI